MPQTRKGRKQHSNTKKQPWIAKKPLSNAKKELRQKFNTDSGNNKNDDKIVSLSYHNEDQPVLSKKQRIATEDNPNHTHQMPAIKMPTAAVSDHACTLPAAERMTIMVIVDVHGF